MTRGLALRVRRFRPPRATGAMVAQVSQALGSFVLQVLAARELGSSGLGLFALLFGSMVMLTAVSTGLIGDSLTVLDRHDPAIRAALWRLTCVTVAAAAIVTLLATLATGMLEPTTAVAFATATVAFMSADLLRRTQMASLHFWRLVGVDSVALVAALTTLAITSTTGPLGLVDFLVALAAGQVTACVVAFCFLPPADRARPPRRWGAVRTVMGFGLWRAAQQFVRPTMLNLARWVVLLAAGQAALGELEAARVFVAPAMLLVQGTGSYLFSSYAGDRAGGTAPLLRRADRAATIMLVGAVLVGVLASATSPLLGRYLTGGAFALSVPGVLGWAVYAASCAAVLPYGSLAAVQGKQIRVLGIRLFDSAFSLALAATALLALGLATPWMPWFLSIGSFLGGLLCRQLLLRPLVRSEHVPVPLGADASDGRRATSAPGRPR